MQFNPKRLAIARKRRLFNKKELAALIGVNDRTIIRCENGETTPTEENLIAFTKALGFSRAFFFGPDIDEPNDGLVSFRSQTAMTAAVRDAALAAGSIGFLLSDWIERRFNLPTIQLPDLHLYEPEMAARVLRQEWKLGEQPISNMIHLLESKGVRVFSLAENSKRVNAFSVWRDGKPYTFLNTFKSAESSRFDAAHELAHLVLHQDGQVTGRTAEDQANCFASAFLMPRADVLASINVVHSLEHIVNYKKRWIVSVAALNHRMHRLGITSDWKYRDFCIQIATKHYNVEEPKPARRERSVVWVKVLKELWADKQTKSDIALALDLPESEVDTLVFGILSPDASERPSAPSAFRVIKNERYV